MIPVLVVFNSNKPVVIIQFHRRLILESGNDVQFFFNQQNKSITIRSIISGSDGPAVIVCYVVLMGHYNKIPINRFVVKHADYEMVLIS